MTHIDGVNSDVVKWTELQCKIHYITLQVVYSDIFILRIKAY